jgi:hypothetical protein
MQEEQKPPIITAQTLIPIGALVVVIGAAMWLTTIFNQTQQNSQELVLMRADIVSLQSQNTNVADRLARVETKLDAILSAISQQ